MMRHSVKAQNILANLLPTNMYSCALCILTKSSEAEYHKLSISRSLDQFQCFESKRSLTIYASYRISRSWRKKEAPGHLYGVQAFPTSPGTCRSSWCQLVNNSLSCNYHISRFLTLASSQTLPILCTADSDTACPHRRRR